MIRKIDWIARDNRSSCRRRRCRHRHCRRRRRRRRRYVGPVVFARQRCRIHGAKLPHETIVKIDAQAVLDTDLRFYRIHSATSVRHVSLWPSKYVPLGNAVLAGLGAVMSQHILVDGLRSREGRTHLFVVQRAHHCGLAPYEGMRGGGIVVGRGIVATG